eukprot:TRINITY_DN5038_c0_g1_i2.p1 TRINITY_DN5038_c0_g1~~TRINITY_DN5038_c0_g1_i2.p1  ORF type:complete len:149 (-),score=21.57 TRINITY_DN5038_c0_g1_i2:127-573(-)
MAANSEVLTEEYEEKYETVINWLNYHLNYIPKFAKTADNIDLLYNKMAHNYQADQIVSTSTEYCNRVKQHYLAEAKQLRMINSNLGVTEAFRSHFDNCLSVLSDIAIELGLTDVTVLDYIDGFINLDQIEEDNIAVTSPVYGYLIIQL